MAEGTAKAAGPVRETGMSRAKRRPPTIAGEQAAVTQGGGARSSPEDGSTAPHDPAERSVPVWEPEESGESEESGVAEGAGPPAASGTAAAPGPRTIRMRIAEGDPWSVMVTSFLLLAGVGILAFATTVVLWILMEAMAPDVLPDLGTVVAIAIGVVTVEVVLGTGLATLGTFLYNLSSLYSGGVEVSVTDDLELPPAAAQVLPAMARARARVRRSLRGRTPWPRSWSR
ncbi:Integral membrane protein [Streptomyces hygroscopicus subsp. limoneus]|nr:Integral membrane protein [Streptomyces hygroscopicus subsp. limoneus]